MLRAHADSPQQPPLLFAEDAVNLPHGRKVQLIWCPIKVKEVTLVIIHVPVNHFNTKGRLKSALSGCRSISIPEASLQPVTPCLSYFKPLKRLNMQPQNTQQLNNSPGIIRVGVQLDGLT